MAYYAHDDARLKELREKVVRYRRLEAIRTELLAQQDTLYWQVKELEEVMRREQDDVEKLEGRSLAAFFSGLTGKKEERLELERQEARAARVKYDAAARELEGVESDLCRCRSELKELQDCEETYAELLKKKAAALKAAGGPDAHGILRLEEQLAALDSRRTELEEAISAGRRALELVKQVQDALDDAEGWGTWDMMGGGLVANVAKHASMDHAQDKVEELRSQLGLLRTELADVTVHAELQVGPDDFMRFADHIFDGFFVDWQVQSRIHQSQEQVGETRAEIERVLARITAMADETDAARAETKGKLDDLLTDTPMK